MTPDYVLARMTVAAIEDTTLIDLRVRDPDPGRRPEMANAVAMAFEDLAAALTRPGTTRPAPAVPRDPVRAGAYCPSSR